MDEITRTYLTNERYLAESEIQNLHIRINVITDLLDDQGKPRAEPVEEGPPEVKAIPPGAFLYAPELGGKFAFSWDTNIDTYEGFLRDVFEQAGFAASLSAVDMWGILKKLEGTLGRNKKAVADSLHKMARKGALHREKRSLNDGTAITCFSRNK